MTFDLLWSWLCGLPAVLDENLALPSLRPRVVLIVKLLFDVKLDVIKSAQGYGHILLTNKQTSTDGEKKTDKGIRNKSRATQINARHILYH